jgi:hypothetical protein
MENWTTSIYDLIEWADGSFDQVYTHDITGDMEFRPATPSQIEAYMRWREWVEAGRPDVTVSFADFIRG